MGSFYLGFYGKCKRRRQQLARIFVRGADELDAAATAPEWLYTSSQLKRGKWAPSLPHMWKQTRPLGLGYQQPRSLQRRSLEHFVRCVRIAEKPAAIKGQKWRMHKKRWFMFTRMLNRRVTSAATTDVGNLDFLKTGFRSTTEATIQPTRKTCWDCSIQTVQTAAQCVIRIAKNTAKM